MINQKTDDFDEMGYINKDFVLEQVSQEEIFALVFGFEPIEFEYTTSPFRRSDNPEENDNHPGCWFEYYEDVLRFKDYADPRNYGRIKLRNMDCFDTVQVFFRLPNFYETLRFIKAKLLDNREYEIKQYKEQQDYKRTLVKKKKKPVEIFVSTRDWEGRDAAYWGKYSITKENLIEDKVFPIQRLKLKNTKKGNFTFNILDRGYAYTDFEMKKKKVYRPYQKTKRLKFITNCSNNDIGDVNRLITFGRQLIISKSYKDCRVLRNLGLNAVWFQNEGQTPDETVLYDLTQRFDKVIVFYDNDQTGIEASQIVSDRINSLFTQTKSTFLYLPEDLIRYKVSDPADLIHRRGKKHLTSFLNEKKLLLL